MHLRPLSLAETAPIADAISSFIGSTFLGAGSLPRDGDLLASRVRATPHQVIAADFDGQVAAVALVIDHGATAIVRWVVLKPRGWSADAPRRLLDAALATCPAAHVFGAFAPANSSRHIAALQDAGFWPRFLRMVMMRPVRQGRPPTPFTLLSPLGDADRTEALAQVHAQLNRVSPGLRVDAELAVGKATGLGDVLVVRDVAGLVSGVAAFQAGVGSEAGSNAMLVRLAAVSDGAPASLERLLDACEAHAAASSLKHLIVSVSMGRPAAYETLVKLRFQTAFQGVAMHRPGEDFAERADALLLEAWH